MIGKGERHVSTKETKSRTPVFWYCRWNLCSFNGCVLGWIWGQDELFVP